MQWILKGNIFNAVGIYYINLPIIEILKNKNFVYCNIHMSTITWFSLSISFTLIAINFVYIHLVWQMYPILHYSFTQYCMSSDVLHTIISIKSYNMQVAKKHLSSVFKFYYQYAPTRRCILTALHKAGFIGKSSTALGKLKSTQVLW